MSRKVTVALALALALACACSGASAPDAAAPGDGAADPLAPPDIWNTVAEVQGACLAHLDRARAIRDEMVAAEGDRDLAGTLVPFNEILLEVDRALPRAELIANVHPDKEVRAAAEKCQQDAMKFISELELARGMYDALAAVPADALDPLAARFLGRALRDYRRAGVDKDEATRAELAKMHEQMTVVGQDFSRAIREDKRYLELDEADLAGLPEDFIKARTPEGGGKIKLSTDYPDFFPVQTYADSEDVRQQLYVKFLERAHPGNEEKLGELLALRHRYVTTLGYSDWADYTAEDKMIKEGAAIAEFIDRVADLARPRMHKDLEDILARKKQDVPDADAVKVWDRFYYVNKIRAERFGVDAQEVRQYFDYAKVKQGLLDLNQKLYGVTFRVTADAETWHDSVEAYEVLDGEEVIARFFLDMHPREGKYGHAAMFQVLSGLNGTQLPVASLVCNFPEPAEGQPALMEHGDVTTFFHEFGHLMHHLLAGRHDWVNFSGINCEWDFVEAPSQIFEEWAWDTAVLQGFAKHHETGEPIPAELVAKMKQADEFGKGVHIMRQMFYAALSYTYHSKSPEGLDLLATVKEVQAKYNPYPYTEGTYVFANFGHLEGYSSMYYTYMWSLVLAKDLFTRFAEAGLLDTATAQAFRETVLAPGGSVDAQQMVETFLGRESKFDAFQAWIEKE